MGNKETFTCPSCGTEYNDEITVDVCELSHTDMKVRDEVKYIVSHMKTRNKTFRDELKKRWEEIKDYTQRQKSGEGNLAGLSEILDGEDLEETGEQKSSNSRNRNRIRLDRQVEREMDSVPGELANYARERGKASILKEMLKRDTTRDCAYRSGRVITTYWNMGKNPPVKISVCTIASQIGHTRGGLGNLERKRRLKEAGCNEPTYSIFSESWRCKLADGMDH
ncbi:MAG: hypothetical protein NTU63_00350 [Candidatus Pacearchaeota archaeon]|nr:hypothetical protein [Candidatus Pacearchaeota archaeon]